MKDSLAANNRLDAASAYQLNTRGENLGGQDNSDDRAVSEAYITTKDVQQLAAMGGDDT